MSTVGNTEIYALIDYEDTYVQPLIKVALDSRMPPSSIKYISSISELPSENSPLLQIRAYESLDFELALKSDSALINAYIIRKALIRKHFLSTAVSNWITKHPTSLLRNHVKPAVEFELDYAEFLDDALLEAYELRASFEKNETLAPEDRGWWILKPSMSDRGQGIRLFSTEQELTSIFESWEAECPDSDEELQTSDTEPEGPIQTPKKDQGDYIITSHLRHFIAQPYIHPPLLFPSLHRKFHIRTYVLAVGALRVYVHKPMLALFSTAPYVPPSSSPSTLPAHLTNTCLQTPAREGTVQDFWCLPSTLPPLPSNPDTDTDTDWKTPVFDTICTITSSLFEAVARTASVHFQPLPSAFEVFGLDFLLDDAANPWLLEVNAFPDFARTGEGLKDVVGGLWEDVVEVGVLPYFGMGGRKAGTERMRLVLDLGRNEDAVKELIYLNR
ncbi:TTL-domain-containing protein [Patellaria atrata CBS 101060]|uniref:TTL-domain-containing protein n=1 Tax=Patellaria atrata CBS 101060 TaxID=1346257 RepID=A0A9P4SIJ8_9PEZI|nr:TTL-domain-containing protein [Patellaria atrata CBS 101060]